MKKRDILFLCQYFYPEYISSATLPYDTAVALADAGYTVDVLCGYPKEYNLEKDSPVQERVEGINIRRIKYIQLDKKKVIGRLVNYFSFTIMALMHFFAMKQYRCIIVYSNPPILPIVPALAKKAFNPRLVFVSYDVYPEIAIKTNSITENGLISRVMKRVNKVVFSNVDKVITLSDDMKNFYINSRESLKEEDIEVIPNWFEQTDNAGKEDSFRNKLFISIQAREKLVVSYFGNMGTAQELETLLEAIRIFKNENDIVFIFAGHGNKFEKIKKIVDEECLENVYTYNFLHEKDFQDALSISDIFVVSLEKGLVGLAVPSKTYSYMSAGKPTIAIMENSADLYVELNESGAGFGIEIGDVSGLVKAIEFLKGNKDKREHMGKRSQALFLRKYTKKICTKQYVGLVNEILGGNTHV